FLAAYVTASGDNDLYTLIDFYKCYRAMVRLKVNCLRLGQVDAEQRPPLEREIRRHQQLAYGYALRYSRPVLWVVCGMPATGKSTVAKALARHLDAPVLRSDIIRKELLGLNTLDAQVKPFGEGIYSEHASGLTYGRMLLQAQAYLERGRAIILDATFGRRRRREEVVRLARDMDAGLIFIECTCSEATIKSRLSAREDRQGASDARRQHFGQFKSHFEPLDELSPMHRMQVDTERPMEHNMRAVFAAAERIGQV
ncbi:MAG: AAA family ATPase, partial [Desulfatitalea sp.]|nr:AAA family ATPase [Desulfatitalea sp.]